MKTNPFKVSLMATAIGLASGTVIAEDMRIDGFASVYYGQALDGDELTDNGEFHGYTDKAGFQGDSRYGIQFRGDLAEGLSATGQIVGRGDLDYSANVTWAYLTYQAADYLAIKAGRQRIPFFLYSDFLDVGYAYTWIAPPSGTYDLSGFDNIDGVNFEFTNYFGDLASRVSLVFGSSNTELDSDGEVISISTEDFWDITWNLNWEWLTFQINYSESNITVSAYDELATGLNSAMSQLPPFLGGGGYTEEQLNLLSVNDDRTHYSGVGLAADWGSIIASAEYTTVKIDDSPISPDRKSWYVMAGYRWNKFTFALTYGYFDTPNNEETSALVSQAVDAINTFIIPNVGEQAIAAGLTQLVEGADLAYFIGEETESYNLTIRYDFHPSAAFKFDYTQEQRDRFTNGAVVPYEPSLVRMGVDLVF